MTNPYDDLPQDRFWRTAVADVPPLQISGLWQPKFRVKRRTRIVTAGSCFAQHFSKALVARGYRWMDHEPGPDWLSPEQRRDYHYGTFSFRTGNIYTPRMLRQWLSWALGAETTPVEVWETGGRFYDPFRPAVEPGGFHSPEELHASRGATLEAIREAVTTAQVFVFTMGLTEAWKNRATGVEYAICPGTAAGAFDPAAHVFVNHGYRDLMADLTACLQLMARVNRRLNVLLTVSPVPLTATASGQHVLTATSQSKAVLRAVAGAACQGRPRVDYFPSYEIITHPVFGGRFFAPNQRSVTAEGVDHVMTSFFQDQAARFGSEARARMNDTPGADDEDAGDETDEDLRCEEEILAAFAPG
ncbi:MAG: GSCFA domain-containing protein [Tabrizicola sp.]|nr:GSCFA domain-containing protein [Tabrizicola sp.]